MKKFLLLATLIVAGWAASAQIIPKKIPDKLVVFTFDDATASQYSIVAPLLKQYGFGATFFVCEFPPNFSDSSKYLNWRQIKELDRMGFEIANHTKNHPGLTRLSEKQIDDQLDYIDRKCDSLGIAKPINFAYPGYDLNPAVVELLKNKGYRFSRAGGDRPYDPLVDHPLLIPSWAMTSGNKGQIMEAFKEAKNGKIVVLTIHGVPDSEHPWVNTPPELFTEYLHYLQEHHFRVIALRDLEQYIDPLEAIKELTPDFSQKLGKK